MPHSMCVAGNKILIAFMNSSDAVIALSYYVASIALFYVALKQWDVFRGVSRWFIFSYGLFIISCGTTHIMDVVVFYYPHYWLQAAIVFWTALVAIPITWFTISVVPWFIGLGVGPEELSSMVNKLQLQVAELTKLQHQVDLKSPEDQDYIEICEKLHQAEKRVEQHNEAINVLVSKTLAWEGVDAR